MVKKGMFKINLMNTKPRSAPDGNAAASFMGEDYTSRYLQGIQMTP